MPITGTVPGVAPAVEQVQTHMHLNNLNWQNLCTVSDAVIIKEVMGVWASFLNLTQNMNLRFRYTFPDGTPHVFYQRTWLTTQEDGVLMVLPVAIQNVLHIDLQSVVLEGAVRTIPWSFVTRAV